MIPDALMRLLLGLLAWLISLLPDVPARPENIGNLTHIISILDSFVPSAALFTSVGLLTGTFTGIVVWKIIKLIASVIP